MTKAMHEIRSEFIEKIGLQAQNEGLPRTAGRLLGLLIWEGEAIAFGDLAEQLQVSRGSISSGTRILEERRLIKRTAKPGQRQDYFELSESPYASMMEGIRSEMNRASHEIGATLEDIPASETGIRSRVASYAAFYRSIGSALEGVIKDMS